jgi:hypothetical protein
MTLQELMQSLTSAELYPVRVEGDAEHDNFGGLVFLGDLDAFIKAAKALSARCVFVTTQTLEESDFLFQEERPRGRFAAAKSRTLSTGTEPDVDLREVDPALNEFKAHLGRECAFRLGVHMPHPRLEYLLRESWWQRFSELREHAMDKVDQERELVASQAGEEGMRRREGVLTAVRELINDPEFAILPTQKAMLGYALQRIPGVETIPVAKLREEIQVLAAKIKAKASEQKK